MRKIILDLAVTLDGYIEGPNGEIDWLEPDGETDFGDILTEILIGIDTIFYGRISYDLWGNYQPGKEASQKLQQAYQLLHSKTKYVFSNTRFHDGIANFVNNEIKETVHQILQQPGENIWLYGGSNLVTTFINEDLIDVYRLAVHPVILGEGKPLFQNVRKRVNLQLTSSKTARSGLIFLNYSRIK